jgi:hypothetical protein
VRMRVTLRKLDGPNNTLENIEDHYLVACYYQCETDSFRPPTDFAAPSFPDLRFSNFRLVYEQPCATVAKMIYDPTRNSFLVCPPKPRAKDGFCAQYENRKNCFPVLNCWTA